MECQIDIILFKDWLGLKGLSQNTQEQYLYYLEKFTPTEISSDSYSHFISKHNNIVARAFLKNLLQYIKTNPQFSPELKNICKEIDMPKITGRKKQKLIEYLKLQEVYKITEFCNCERDKLITLISFYGGLRESEICISDNNDYKLSFNSFSWSNWSKDQTQVLALKVMGKGSKERKVFVPNHIAGRIIQWVREDNLKRQRTKEDPLFNISVRRWFYILAQASKKALGKPVNPHLLRHSCSMWLKSLGWSDTERQKYLGHSDITTTVRYDHTSNDDLKLKFNKIQ